VVQALIGIFGGECSSLPPSSTSERVKVRGGRVYQGRIFRTFSYFRTRPKRATREARVSGPTLLPSAAFQLSPRFALLVRVLRCAEPESTSGGGDALIFEWEPVVDYLPPIGVCALRASFPRCTEKCASRSLYTSERSTEPRRSTTCCTQTLGL